MAKAKLTFNRLAQDSQEYGSDDEHMVSRVFFSIEVDGKISQNLYADIKQLVGSNFESGSLEVSKPHGYSGPFNHGAFQTAAEQYYRGLVGSTGSGINIAGGKNIRMRNNVFGKAAVFEFEVSKDGASW